MSTEVQPPSPQEMTSSSRLPFMKGVEKQGRAPPIAFKTQASRRQHSRSSSLSTVFTKLLPSYRSEKGHTLRKRIDTRHNHIEIKGTHNYCDRSADRIQLLSETPILKSTTRSQPSETHHDVCEQQKTGAFKRLLGSIKSMGKSKDEGIQQSKDHDRKRGNSQMESSQSLQPVGAHKAAIANATKHSDDKEITKTQQMFENKKARREQRRSLIESGDFLGVQGANPRTGYWDISDTTSSEPSQMNDEAQKMLARQAQEVAERKWRYEQAQLEMQIELQRVQALRDEKKRDKLEQKRREMRMRQKGKWRLSENGWSSVAEPDLSPIEQSLAGTPVTELAPIYRLFPIPTANNPASHTDIKSVRQLDYFGHGHASSAVTRDDGSTSDKASLRLRPNVIPRKPVGSSSRRTNNSSTDTIIHGSGMHTPLRTPSVEKSNEKSPLKTGEIKARTAQEPDSILKESSAISAPSPFLGQRASSMEPPDLAERKATAILSRSASTSRVLIRPQLGQNPENISPGKRIMSLNEFPPVYIRDPVAARGPLSCQIPMANFPVWSPPTIIETQADQQPSFTNMCIITTTGLDPPQPPSQLDGVLESTNAVQVKAPVPSYKMNRTTLRNQSPQQESPRKLQSVESQHLPADIGTSSESQLTPTKERVATLCQAASAESVNIEMQSTRTSTSTSQRRRRKEKQAAREAARLAFHQTQTPMAHQTHSASNMSNEALEVMPVIIGSAGISAIQVRGDRLVVTHPEPEAENMRAALVASRASNKTPRRTPVNQYAAPVAGNRASNNTTRRAPVNLNLGPVTENRASNNTNRRAPVNQNPRSVTDSRAPNNTIRTAVRIYSGPVSQPLSTRQVVVHIILNAWGLVEPAFNPRSALRRRLNEQRLTFQDIILLLAAGLFMIGVFIITMLAARLVGKAIQIVTLLGILFRLLAGM